MTAVRNCLCTDGNPPRAVIFMKKRDYYRGTALNILRIYKALRESERSGEGFITVSEVARRTGLHKWTISRTLDLYMEPLVEIVKPEELEAVGLQAKLLRLKNPDMTPSQVINYLKVRRKINP